MVTKRPDNIQGKPGQDRESIEQEKKCATVVKTFAYDKTI